MTTRSTIRRPAKLILTAGLGFVVLYAFHALSVLTFAAIGQIPGTPNGTKGLVLSGVLAIASTTVCFQSLTSRQSLYRGLGTLSSAASGAILGVFVASQLSGQQITWVVLGLMAGCCCFGSMAFWAYGGQEEDIRRLVGSAIALVNGLCAYALAFGLSAWFFGAIAAKSWLLASMFGIATLLSLFAARRSLAICESK
ncbi:hypothetical protein [cf. Phormidesmis sp. LEGE 11477]|uniref:hypothetical protein n=1 Tax=cf. Phormidesmis sp. LEGE 11477 TaxID=1828680 RepID=UPI001881742C|nr:hypothetical protein [cf. Phormidesmis sp. LEGE 11477]MBE9061939.1 hypothetical protein [cf. Phormidesmis sp. LEGE 11477]